MDAKTKSIALGVVALIILASLLGSIVYLSQVAKKKPAGTGTNSLSRLPVASTTPSPTTGTNQPTQQGAAKIFAGSGFVINYPKNWGLLTCGNSQNFEFDPVNGADTKNVVCDQALKPVTVIVTGRLSCAGDTIKLGNNQVTKSKAPTSTGVNYEWCLMVGGKGLDITHRVSSDGSRATSKEDFSQSIEEVITNIKQSPQGS